MKRGEAQKEFKATIRMNCQLLEQWKEGEISFGRMAEELSKSILYTADNIGMLPPAYIERGFEAINLDMRGDNESSYCL